jgi:two-component system, LytTR family, response regulator
VKKSDTGTVSAVIVDDEPAARDAIRVLLGDHSVIRVVGEAGNGREAIDEVRRLKPDLLFLDIQMPDEDGFTVLEQLGADVPAGVVFVTAHDRHAVRAFEVHALDYLLKPFGRPRFAAAVDRALDRLRALDALTLRRTLDSIVDDRRLPDEPSELSTAGEREESAAAPRRIGVRTGGKLIVVDVGSIDWVEASGDYARIHSGAQSWLITQRMHALERLLSHGEFVRVHRSLIVNLERIRELHREPDGAGTVVLTTGIRLRIARGRWDALQKALRMTRG